MKLSKSSTTPLAEKALKRHFSGCPLHDLVTSSRTFPVAARVDVQLAVQRLFAEHTRADLFGLHTQFGHETLTIAHLLGNAHYPVVINPLQYEEVDIGETLPARCVRQALWLSYDGDTPFSLLLSPAIFFGRPNGTHIEIAVGAGEAGSNLSRRMFDELERLARFLQPAMVVIEDVDLIARARETMYGPCDESLLNKLPNEMDGLREPQNSTGGPVSAEDLSAALEEMLFSGGSLNAKLWGAAGLSGAGG